MKKIGDITQNTSNIPVDLSKLTGDSILSTEVASSQHCDNYMPLIPKYDLNRNNIITFKSNAAPRNTIDCLCLLSSEKLITSFWSEKLGIWDIKMENSTDNTTSNNISFNKVIEVFSHDDCINSLHISENLLFIGSDKYIIKILDKNSYADVQTLNGMHPSTVLFLHHVPSSNQLVSVTDCEIEIWDIVDGICKKTVRTENEIISSQLLFGMQSLAYTQSNKVHILSLENYTVTNILVCNSSTKYLKLLDDFRLAIFCSGDDDSEVQIWDLSRANNPACMKILKIKKPDNYNRSVYSCKLLQVFNDGLLLGVFNNNIMNIWNLNNGSCIQSLTTRGVDIRNCCLLPNGGLLCCWSGFVNVVGIYKLLDNIELDKDSPNVIHIRNIIDNCIKIFTPNSVHFSQQAWHKINFININLPEEICKLIAVEYMHLSILDYDLNLSGLGFAKYIIDNYVFGVNNNITQELIKKHQEAQIELKKIFEHHDLVLYSSMLCALRDESSMMDAETKINMTESKKTLNKYIYENSFLPAYNQAELGYLCQAQRTELYKLTKQYGNGELDDKPKQNILTKDDFTAIFSRMKKIGGL